MRFEQLTRTVLTEKYFDYQIPEDKEKLMYDFYTLAHLSQFNMDAVIGNKKDPYGNEIQTGTMRRELDEDMKESYRDAQKKVQEYLKSHMLESVMFSICAEFRHIYDKNDNDTILEFFDKMGMKPFIKSYTEHYMKLDSKFYDFIKDENRVSSGDVLYNNSKSYVNSYKALKRSGVDPEKFVKATERAYNELHWRTSYGGPKWAAISKGWLLLYNAKSDIQKFIAIDHVYDLQHNTDTVFNKIQAYAKAGSYSWIKKALDKKANLTNPYELLTMCSGTIRLIAQRVLKSEGFKGWGDYLGQEQKTFGNLKVNHNETKEDEIPANDKNMPVQNTADKPSPLSDSTKLYDESTPEEIYKYIKNNVETGKRAGLGDGNIVFIGKGIGLHTGPSLYEAMNKIKLENMPRNLVTTISGAPAMGSYSSNYYYIKKEYWDQISAKFEKSTESQTPVEDFSQEELPALSAPNEEIFKFFDKNPNNHNVTYSTAFIYLGKGDKEYGKKIKKLILKIRPSDMEAHGTVMNYAGSDVDNNDKDNSTFWISKANWDVIKDSLNIDKTESKKDDLPNSNDSNKTISNYLNTNSLLSIFDKTESKKDDFPNLNDSDETIFNFFDKLSKNNSTQHYVFLGHGDKEYGKKVKKLILKIKPDGIYSDGTVMDYQGTDADDMDTGTSPSIFLDPIGT